MQHAVELVTPACAFEGCMKFVYMTYRRTDDIGSSFAPQFACGVDHIRHLVVAQALERRGVPVRVEFEIENPNFETSFSLYRLKG